MHVLNQGSRCPTSCVAIARYTRGSTDDGPGVSINRTGGFSSPICCVMICPSNRAFPGSVFVSSILHYQVCSLRLLRTKSAASRQFSTIPPARRNGQIGTPAPRTRIRCFRVPNTPVSQVGILQTQIYLQRRGFSALGACLGFPD